MECIMTPEEEWLEAVLLYGDGNDASEEYLSNTYHELYGKDNAHFEALISNL